MYFTYIRSLSTKSFMVMSILLAPYCVGPPVNFKSMEWNGKQ